MRSIKTASGLYQYQKLAEDMAQKIHSGVYKVGEKLPSIRYLHRQLNLSISTILKAYVELEKQRLIHSREKSGYFVSPAILDEALKLKTKMHRSVPGKVTLGTLAYDIVEAFSNPDAVKLGGSIPDKSLMPDKALSRILKAIPFNTLSRLLGNIEHPMGNLHLRRHIAKRTMGYINSISDKDILITNGCMDAVSLCLSTITQKGDTILVESPTFPWFLQLIEDLSLYAIEIPTDPSTGMDIAQLETVLEENTIHAAILMSNFQNPLGFQLSDEKKQKIVSIFTRKKIPLIEDDIYGDIHFESAHPKSFKSFDTKGWVLYCTSFSKSISPGLRVGWSLPGRFLDKVKQLKLNRDIASPSINQYVIAEYLNTGGYDRHLRRLSAALKTQINDMSLAISREFPKGTRISLPKGGLTLWVELYESFDSLDFYERAMRENIAIFPGIICSSTPIYKNCIRVSCGSPFDARVENAIKRLGEML